SVIIHRQPISTLFPYTTLFRSRNSIIWGNTRRSNTIDNIISSSGTPTYSYCLIQGSSSESWNTSFGTDGGHNIDEDPLFSDAANGDYTLKEGSPLINAGNKTLFNSGQIPDLSAITTDLAGNPRIVADSVDIGAYERQKKQYVITFSGLEDGKITAVYGTADLSPASASPDAAISYSLPADNGVAEIVDGKVKVISAGEVELTASIAENDDYKALSVSKILKITKAPLTITAKDSSKI